MSEYEPLSPVDVERKLRQCVNDLYYAEKELRETRDTEVDADLAYKSAYRRAILCEECPKVTRGGVSAAERDAWVENQCADEYRALRLAQVRREAAADHLRTIKDTANAVQTLSGLVKQAFSIAGKDDAVR